MKRRSFLGLLSLAPAVPLAAGAVAKQLKTRDLTPEAAEDYTEFGELEGELGQITVHKPPYEFCIYDPVTDRRIPCHFDPDDLVIIRDYLKERIRVSGFVTYRRKDDAPVSVSVEDWLAIPRDENLPSIEDLHAARIDFTGGRKSEDVIADLRRPHG